ncbi:type II toxin-antitoxin system HigA family antitoxin [Pedobacter mendelii]|uniref:HTH-type transcriptional regulator / antitoxin HigA n=2 Tax=Pedobacter mendelii TaxID=1908240 RepID=A0ABQ2BBE1_9SPHI|nr:hypothetical protein GCM10008119_01350 [Pedobacter mendelii]
MLKIIKTEEEYELALEKAYSLLQEDIVLGSDQADELELITLLIEHYEEANYPIMPSSPIEAIKFRLDQLGKTQTELSKMFVVRSGQSEILSVSAN